MSVELLLILCLQRVGLNCLQPQEIETGEYYASYEAAAQAGLDKLDRLGRRPGWRPILAGVAYKAVEERR